MVEEEAIGSLVSRRHSCYKEAHQKDGIPRVEPTHKVVAFQSTVHDGSISLLCDAFLGHLVVGPVREPPHVGTYFAKFDGARSVISYRLLEVIVELAIVEENIGVMVPPIEVAFHRFEGLQNTIEFFVSGQDHKGSVGTGLAGVRLQAASDEHLVVLLGNFPTARQFSLAAPFHSRHQYQLELTE